MTTPLSDTEAIERERAKFQSWVVDGGLEAKRDLRHDYAQDSTWYAWQGWLAASEGREELLKALAEYERLLRAHHPGLAQKLKALHEHAESARSLLKHTGDSK